MNALILDPIELDDTPAALALCDKLDAVERAFTHVTEEDAA